MIAAVYPAKLAGTIDAIPSKTHAHRLLIGASLYGDRTRINCAAVSEDIQATVGCLRALGSRLIRQPYGYFAERMDFQKDGSPILDCGESGSTYRFLLPAACALGRPSVFRLGGRLPQRPMDELFGALEEHGAVISGKGTAEMTTGGRLLPGVYRLRGDISSQYISGLLFALPLLEGDSEIAVAGPIESKGYIEATLSALRVFGLDMRLESGRIKVPGCRRCGSVGEKILSVEGDWSNAAFWLAAGAAGGGPVSVRGLDPGSVQGDREICRILSSFGAEIKESGDEISASGSGLRGISVDASDIPDLVPAIAVAAAGAEGETVIYNARRLRYKESDRLRTVAAAINGLGGEAEETEDGLIIRGKGKLRGGTVDSFNDHRIAMLAASAAVVCDGPVVVRGAEAVAKSYPAFFDDLKKLGAEIAEAY